MVNDAAIPPEEQFESHCVIELSAKCQDELVDWLIQRIVAPKAVGGAELVVRPVRDVQTSQYRYLHVCAPFYRLMEMAEWLEMAKPDISNQGVLKEFTVKTLSKFVADVNNPSAQLFTYAEKARMVHYEINEVRAKNEELNLFSTQDNLRFSVGQSIFTEIQRKDLVNKVYSLHNKEELKHLEKEWLRTSLLTTQPLDSIRRYFGEHIAIYFAFLEFYTEMLVPATLLAIVMFLVNFFSLESLHGIGAFAVFNMLWATFFFVRWKRYCATLAYRWGTLLKPNEQLELPRPQFRGKMGKNPVTGYPEPVYSELNRNLWITFVSYPSVALCLFTSAYVLNKYMTEQNKFSATAETVAVQAAGFWSFLWAYIPSVIYTVWTKCFSLIYGRTAVWLTNKENHRLQSQYEFHLIWKLLLFNFVNSFSSLFYIAFWIQDLGLLRTHLAAQLITNQMTDQIPETVLPWVKVRFELWWLKQQARMREANDGDYDDPHFAALKEQATIEGQLPEYPGTFDDYVELFLQFGHCFLFSSAFPVAPLFALLNNLIEIKGDGFKVCNVIRRPFAQPANGIGPWQVAFELMGFVAVVTNLALIFVAPATKNSFPATWTNGQLILAFVVLEHLLVITKLSLKSVVPAVPKHIGTEIARNEYEMKLAVREERARESRKEIEQRKMSRPILGWTPTASQGHARNATMPTGNITQRKRDATKL